MKRHVIISGRHVTKLENSGFEYSNTTNFKEQFLAETKAFLPEINK